MKSKIMLLLCISSLLSSCASYEPFVGVTHGKNKSYFAPVDAWTYNYEDILSGNVNGGCIPNTSGVDIPDVGKKRWGGGGSSCGGFPLPAKWYPGMHVRVSWRVDPYPDWRPRLLPGGGVVSDPVQSEIMYRYVENYSVSVPIPPYDPKVASMVLVHFLACNQIFITYSPYVDEKTYDHDFALFRESQKLCKPRPVVKSMADYKKHKAQMDAIKEERRHIPQVILPQYMQKLEAEGKLPVTDDKKSKR